MLPARLARFECLPPRLLPWWVQVFDRNGNGTVEQEEFSAALGDMVSCGGPRAAMLHDPMARAQLHAP
jgi:hypothetical protein